MLYEALQGVVIVPQTNNVALFIDLLPLGYGLERQICPFPWLAFLNKGTIWFSPNLRCLEKKKKKKQRTNKGTQRYSPVPRSPHWDGGFPSRSLACMTFSKSHHLPRVAKNEDKILRWKVIAFCVSLQAYMLYPSLMELFWFRGMKTTGLMQCGKSYLGLRVIILSGFVFPTEESWVHSLSSCMMEFYRNSVTGGPTVTVWSMDIKVMEDPPHK